MWPGRRGLCSFGTISRLPKLHSRIGLAVSTISAMARTRYFVALVLVFILGVGGPAELLIAQTAKPAAATAPPVDGGWPRAYSTASSARVVLYQPQIASWVNQKRITAYMAVSYTASGADKPALGTFKIEADTSVALSERLVSFTELTIPEANFSTLPKDQVKAVVSEIVEAIPRGDRVIALDRVLANIDTSQIVPKNVEGVKADPPVMFFSKKPAALVVFDGDPIWSPIEGNDLKFAVNTNWDLFEHTVTKTYYLRIDNSWMTASAVQGPWTPAGKLPDSFAKLPADENWKDVKAALPGQKIAAGKESNVFVSLKPAEMILLKGEPSYVTVNGTSLLWVNNTESDVFRAGKGGLIYYLVAGRWFSAPDFSGPWTFASPALPADFKKIPEEHPRSRVLASVPGTSKAAEAVLLASVPQTATVSRKDIKAPDVVYQGAPQFEPIEQTTVARAVNTDKDIIKVGDLYYMCFQGVWFMAKSASGPWEVTSEVPKAIYEIPISSPASSVTYVTVESSTADTVSYAATAAYMGTMVAFGCVVWGSGYYYPPYAYYGGFYPVYYGHYPTYGWGASYNPWTGAYTRGAVAYGPYGGAGIGARYNPRTGTYSRAAVAYGPYGARGAGQAYNPRTGAYGATRQASNAYGSWGATAVTRGDDWAATTRRTNNVTGATTRRTETSNGSAVSRTGATGNRTTVAQGNDGDLYAGRDGNVYKKEQGGDFQKYENGGWNDAQKPTQQQRDDAAARAQGAQRTNDASRVNSGSATRGSSSTYRPSGGGGGGSRAGGGGGGRRR
jgi:hypothetical protein